MNALLAAEKTLTLDQLDWKILKELCVNARISNTEIGRRVGLSSPAVAERILKLEEYKFICAHRSIVDLEKIGLTVQAFITIKFSSLKSNEWIEVIESVPEILEWNTITGPSSMILKVATHSTRKLHDIIAYLENYGETNTFLILSGNVKESFFSAPIKCSNGHLIKN